MSAWSNLRWRWMHVNNLKDLFKTCISFILWLHPGTARKLWKIIEEPFLNYSLHGLVESNVKPPCNSLVKPDVRLLHLKCLSGHLIPSKQLLAQSEGINKVLIFNECFFLLTLPEIAEPNKVQTSPCLWSSSCLCIPCHCQFQRISQVSAWN